MLKAIAFSEPCRINNTDTVTELSVSRGLSGLDWRGG